MVFMTLILLELIRNTVALSWNCASTSGTFNRSTDCTVSNVIVSGTLEIIGTNTNMNHLVTLTATDMNRHFYVNGESTKLTLRYLKLYKGNHNRHGAFLDE